MRSLLYVWVSILVLGSSCSSNPCGTLSDTTKQKIVATIGKTYKGVIQLADGSQKAYTLQLAHDPTRGTSVASTSSFSFIRSAHALSCLPPSVGIQGSFASESQLHPGMQIRGRFELSSGNTMFLWSVESSTDSALGAKYLFYIYLDNDYAFTRGDYSDQSKGKSESQKGKFLSFTE